MKKRLLNALLFPVLAAGLDTTRWQYQAPIQVSPDSNGIASARVTRDIYVHSRPDLSDLRVLRGGEETAYLIETRRGATENREFEPVVVDQSVVPGRGLRLTLDIGGHSKHTRVRIATGETNFRQKVRIETSDDNRSWAVVRDDGYVFDFSQGDRHVAVLSVDYPASTMRYVRVTISGWMKTEAVRQVWSAYHHERPAERAVMDTIAPQRSEDPDTKSSVLLLDLKQAGVPYDWIRLESGEAHFYRAAELETSTDSKTWQFTASGTIYQTTSESSPALAFGEHHDRYLRLRIFNGDDRPIPVKNVVLESTVRLLKFALAGGAQQFYLFTGNPDARAREAPQPEVSAALLASSANPAYRPAPPPVKPWSERYPQLLYGTLALAIVVMGYVTIRFLLKVKSAPG
jgi:hypothetical protein